MYRVMLIDDEEKMRKLMRLTVEWEMLGYKIAGEASSGIEAINVIDEINPDVLFVDIRMPFMDGIEFAKVAIERYPHLKIFILTAYNDFEYARRCIGIGVTQYLLKPINKSEINDSLSRLKEVLDIESKEQPDIRPVSVTHDSTVEKVKVYLLEHFSDPELNLTQVAQVFGFNASYLSRMFKEETGHAFTDYLNGCRMEHAISLAKENQYMYQVANQVGIPDPNYFGKCFKRYTGLTFSQYVKKSSI